MELNQDFFRTLLDEASQSPRLRQSFDMRTSASDQSQRMLNALQPGTAVPIHRHHGSSESVLCLKGRLDEVLYTEETLPGGETALRETARYRLGTDGLAAGCQVPTGAWHTVEVLEPSIIFEAKDGPYAPAQPSDLWNGPVVKAGGDVQQ